MEGERMSRETLSKEEETLGGGGCQRWYWELKTKPLRGKYCFLNFGLGELLGLRV